MSRLAAKDGEVNRTQYEEERFFLGRVKTSVHVWALTIHAGGTHKECFFIVDFDVFILRGTMLCTSRTYGRTKNLYQVCCAIFT